MLKLHGRAVLASTILLASCGDEELVSPFEDATYLKRTWRTIFEPYDVHAAFPIRTGLQPGDILALCTKGDGSDLDQWKRVASLDGVPAVLERFAKSRMAYTAVGVSTAASGPAGAASSPAPFALNASPTTADFASFPALMWASNKAAGVGAALPVGVTTSAVGGARSSTGHYLLEVPGAEYMEIPWLALRSLVDTGGIETFAPNGTTKLDNLWDEVKNTGCEVKEIAVVQTAYQTRRLTVSMGRTQAAALSARAAYLLPQDSTRKAVFDALASVAVGASASPAASGAPLPQSSDARLTQLLVSLDAALNAADQNARSSVPGVRISYSKSEGYAASLDYTYQRPMTFAVKMFIIEKPQQGQGSNQGKPTLTNELPTTSAPANDTPLK